MQDVGIICVKIYDDLALEAWRYTVGDEIEQKTENKEKISERGREREREREKKREKEMLVSYEGKYIMRLSGQHGLRANQQSGSQYFEI